MSITLDWNLETGVSTSLLDVYNSSVPIENKFVLTIIRGVRG